MIHYFNPGHEHAVLNGSPFYTMPANQIIMQNNLDYLPAWYALSHDYVFVGNQLNNPFIESVKQLNPLAKAITEQDLRIKKYNIENEEVCLWGISPQSIYFFEKLNREYGLNLIIPQWNDIYRKLCSRTAAKDCLEFIIDSIENENIPNNKQSPISESIIPTFYSRQKDVEEFITENKNDNFIIKSPYSSSGRGHLWINGNKLSRSSKQILHGMIKKQGIVSLEKVLNKKLDFALEFISDGNGNIDFIGYSLFLTNSKGAYKGNYLISQKEIENRIFSFIPELLLTSVKQYLIDFLKQKFSLNYKGCIGVDMMIYEEKRSYKLHPCLEINLRYNMGYLALNIYKNHINQDSKGFFSISYEATPKAILKKHKELQQSNPIIISDKKIDSGYLSLCPVNENSNYLAYIIIRTNS